MILFGKELRLRTHTCPTCKAKDQTITLLADLVDWHRSQPPPSAAVGRPFRPPESIGKLWDTDEEEDITAALEAGAISAEAAERALASIQALNQTVELR